MTTLTALFGTPLTASIDAAAIDAAIRIAVLLALALATARLLRGASAALRHSVLTAAILGALALPVLIIALPSWHFAIPGADAARGLAGRVSRAVATPDEPRPSVSVPEPASTSASPMMTSTAVHRQTVTPSLEAGSSTAATAALATRSDGSRAPVRWSVVVLALWLAGAIAALTPLLLGALHLRAIGRRSRDVESDALDDFGARLARTLGIRRVVRVVQGEGAATPMTWGVLRPVLLVPAGFAEWPEARQRDVLLHELAHVARYDCLTQHLAQVVCALHWYNPLAWMTARRLRIERERACDDRVLLAGARASEYAEHILDIARTLRTPRLAGAAALAMARPSHLEGRLLALLDTQRRRAVLTPRRALGIGTATLAIAATIATLSPWGAQRAEATEPNRSIDLSEIINARPDTDSVRAPRRVIRDDSLYAQLSALQTQLSAVMSAPGNVRDSLLEQLVARHKLVGPGTVLHDGQELTMSAGGGAIVKSLGATDTNPENFTLPGCTFETHRSSSATVVEDDDSHMKASVKNGDCEITLQREGDVAFNDDFTDIASIAADGWLTISDKGGRETHTLHITNDGGRMTRSWTVNGTARPYDAAAAQWLATALQTLDRYTNFSNGARMKSVYRQRGANGVLDEVSSVSSDYTMRSDVDQLLKMTKLDAAQTERVLGFAASNMSSDYDRSQLLQSLLKAGLITPALQSKYVDAAAKISGDYERRQVLTALVDDGNLGVESQNAILNAARSISSDYDMREMLSEVVKKYGLSKATAPAFLAGAARISSDYDMRTLLTEVLDDQKNLDPSIIDSFLALAQKRIGSDYDKAEFYIAVAEHGPNTEEARERVAKAAEASIQSESDYGRVLSSLRRLKSGNNRQ